MTEIMLRDASAAHGLKHVILRYFNVAGADPQCRTGQSTAGATHLIKVAVEAALGLRPKIDVFGTDYPTPDGTGIRDYIHVSDLVLAHRDALRHLRAGASSATLNCGYGHGFSVREVDRRGQARIGRRFQGRDGAAAGRRPGADRRRLDLKSAKHCDGEPRYRRSGKDRRRRAEVGTSPHGAARRQDKPARAIGPRLGSATSDSQFPPCVISLENSATSEQGRRRRSRRH